MTDLTQNLINRYKEIIKGDYSYEILEEAKKDRYSILSPKVLKLLRKYVIEYKPKEYLFEGQKGGKYSSASVQQLMRLMDL